MTGLAGPGRDWLGWVVFRLVVVYGILQAVVWLSSLKLSQRIPQFSKKFTRVGIYIRSCSHLPPSTTFVVLGSAVRGCVVGR